MKYRALLKDSLDQIFATEYKNMKRIVSNLRCSVSVWKAIQWVLMTSISVMVLLVTR